MKVMIVRIENFTNSQTEDLIKSFFESRNYEVIVKSFDISVAAEIPEVLLKNSLSIDYMIGVGLAGFFVLSETNSNSRIVINPWMSPSQKLLQEEDFSQNLLSILKKLEAKTYDWVDAEMRVAAYGIFTSDADTFDKDQFLKIYGRNMAGINKYSLMEEENLPQKIEKSLKYYEHIASLNYWNYMPGYIKI